MTKRILFPFAADRDLNQGYSWSMELAIKMNASLCLFTAVPEKTESQNHWLGKVQQRLIHAKEAYLLRLKSTSGQASLAPTEKCVEEGDLGGTLVTYLRKNQFDLVVVDPSATAMTDAQVQAVVENAQGVIVLPVEATSIKGPDTDNQKADNFYEVLRKSECYRLEGNFFKTLGNDKPLFNYLRNIFSKRERTSL